MTPVERRRRRLAHLLELAQNYRGWSRRELARALGRDPTKLIPGSGIPKLDLVVDLAAVLDWSVEDVVGFFWSREEAAEETAEQRSHDFAGLDQQARDAHRSGQYMLMTKLAETAYGIAQTPDERARACNREAGGWDGMGRFQNSLRAVQRGLQEPGVGGELRRMLQSNLANAYYTLWSLVEAKSIAGDLIEWYRHNPPESPRDRRSQAFAHYVRGHAHRRLLGNEHDRAVHFARLAQQDLSLAEQLYLDIERETGDASFAGIANTCRGGRIEVDVTLGLRTPGAAVEAFRRGLDADIAEARPGDWLESWGWWCIFACNVILRSISDEQELQHLMAIFTNKADEIAEALDSWTIRERVFTMEHTRWERAVGCTGFQIPHTVDKEDIRVITGTMARFPAFRETGWHILRSARLVAES